MQDLNQLYDTTVRALPVEEQVKFASLILNHVEANKQKHEAVGSTKRSILDILDELPGGRIFKTPEEVDAYLREERDSWER